MRKRLLLLVFIATSLCHAAFAQTITITTTNTPSVCYNDGTLTINASGGTGPYIDSIISGPTNPNLTYPIALPSGQNHFINLPHGTFTIRVHDAAGHVGTFTAVVGGSYVFPSMTLSSFGTSVTATRTPGTGRPPFQYALSSTSANSGFGPYQSSGSFGTFGHLCRGTYWVRILDSCGNIFTDNITLYYQNTVNVNCVNFDAHTANISASGVPPITYRAYDQSGNLIATSSTGVFPTLPPRSLYTFTATDSCGVTGTTLQVTEPTATYGVVNPFDSTIRLADISGNYSFPPFILTCLNCAPPQADTLLSYSHGSHPILFTGISLDSTYYISFTDGCDHTIRIDTVGPGAGGGGGFGGGSGGFTPTSCNSMQVYFTDVNGTHIPSSQIDSVVLWDGTHWTTSYNGIFTHIPVTGGSVQDTIIGYLHGGLRSILTLHVNVPFS
ncbi:MAG: hypothetical protein JWO03_1740, partial [Bacteroidetes bacterium]|nr:hypothetical protein [Bacteroidota bacterium]